MAEGLESKTSKTPPAVLEYRSEANRSALACNPTAFFGWLFALAAILAFMGLGVFLSSYEFETAAIYGVLPALPALVLGAYGLRRARRMRLRGTFLAAFALAVGILGLLMLAWMIYVAVHNYLLDARYSYTRCQSHLKQIGQAIQLHNDTYGSTPRDCAAMVLNCDVPQSIFICPGSNDMELGGLPYDQQAAALSRPGYCSYIYLGANVDLKKIPPNFIMAYEKLENHESGINVLRADGTVEWLRLKRAKHVIAELEAGHNPPSE